MGNTFYFEWEVTFQAWLQAILPSSLMTVISQFSLFGETMLMIAVLGLFYWCLDKETGKKIGLNIILVSIWGPMLKNIILRRRPYFDNDSIQIYRPVEPDRDLYSVYAQGYSFPSGHSSGSAVLYGSMARYLHKRWLTVLAFLLPFLVGFSRVAVGAHYVTDVLGGWALGAAVIFLVPWIRSRFTNRTVFFAVVLLVTVPGFFFCDTSDYFTSMGMLFGYMLAIPFEERFVRFEGTRSLPRIILRVLGGGILYIVLNYALKAPFRSEFLESELYAASLVRCGRYTIIIFLLLAIYPILFRYTARLKAGKK